MLNRSLMRLVWFIPWILGFLALSACRGILSEFEPATFNLPAARNVDDLFGRELPQTRQEQGPCILREVRFSSLQWTKQGAHRIEIAAYLATPKGDKPLPGVVYAHGLGGEADRKTVFEICAKLGAVGLSLFGPGVGLSQGSAATPKDARLLLPHGGDIRESWLYAYVYAVLRAVTYLTTRPEVNPAAIVVTGFSMGGVATLISNGVDPRIRGAVPVAATGALGDAARADTWMQKLVHHAGGMPLSSPPSKEFLRRLDPLAFASRQHGLVFHFLGSQDQFFPIPSAIQTYEALRAPDKRLSVMPNYDHGWDFRNRDEEFIRRWTALLRSMLAAIKDPATLAELPKAPKVERRGNRIEVHPRPKRGWIALSRDCGYTFDERPLLADGSIPLDREEQGAELVYFAEVEGPNEVIVTSIPTWPKSCTVRVRPFKGSP